jgi:uncharacterized protein
MEDRKRRFDDKTEVRGRIAEALKKAVGNAAFFDGVHIFTPHADIPDDAALRLVVLPPENWYSRDEARAAFDTVLACVRNNGSKPRYRGNRLIFLAADHGTLSRVSDAARIALAWASIVDDVKEGRLNIDLLQKNQAEKELKTADEVLPRAARECYKWLLCPVQETPTDPKPNVEAFALNTTAGSVGGEIERVCIDNELVIATWSPIHLRAKLKELYWKEGQSAVGAAVFFEDTLRYLYMPRFKNREVLALAIKTGAASRDFFGTAYGRSGDRFEGFSLGTGSAIFDDTLLLIEPDAAKAQEAHRNTLATTSPESGGTVSHTSAGKPSGLRDAAGQYEGAKSAGAPALRARSFHGAADIAPATAKMRLVQIAEEIIAVLGSDPNATVKVVLEVSADFPEGATDTVKRAVSENARSLGLKSADWE